MITANELKDKIAQYERMSISAKDRMEQEWYNGYLAALRDYYNTFPRERIFEKSETEEG